ncbi:SDR family NAD(P)-dependent oxidoreductase [Chelatococcus asaccharovorans]|uniref:SDR family NAD(P)-dependent oxidoreductase n=1 Tax=Chelatococcus asaccharovorans TaxID=28210 RepID=UPI00224C6E33|nr:SDR family NAD(P)-dependent oxidoreductase [Chelatococcus asaccharovorans]CAH1671563.1 Short-subunit dehydrogenase [Chelatococcus asaccharovorans]CAH1677003.1 Short-subunit dehydrogenase [Chelatococcus asaccharovorans]
MVGRRALVTGGSRGIGRAIAAAMTAAGHDVTILGRNRASLDEALAQGVAARGEVVDVTDVDRLATLAGAGYDILVNNAGGAGTAPFLKSDRALFSRMMALNVESAAEAMRAALPGMIERGFGRVINVASTAGVKGYAYVSAYVAAKHAVVGLTRAVALEMAKTGVTINAVCPGYTDTDLVADSVKSIVAKTQRSAEEAKAHFTASNPLGRLIKPEEVASAAVWLASDGAAAMTGQCIVIAGGEV